MCTVYAIQESAVYIKEEYERGKYKPFIPNSPDLDPDLDDLQNKFADKILKSITISKTTKRTTPGLYCNCFVTEEEVSTNTIKSILQSKFSKGLHIEKDKSGSYKAILDNTQPNAVVQRDSNDTEESRSDNSDLSTIATYPTMSTRHWTANDRPKGSRKS